MMPQRFRLTRHLHAYYLLYYCYYLKLTFRAAEVLASSSLVPRFADEEIEARREQVT